MADISNLTNFLGDIADAIRTKKETTEQIPAENFDQEILSIETGIDTSDANATVTDIASGKTAYVNGEKITGTLIETAQIGGGSDGEVNVYTDSIGISETNNQDLIVKNGATISATTTNEKMVTAIGLTSEKIVKGNTILGIEGTAETGTEINNQDKEITANGTYTADEGYTGLGTVTVNVPQGEDLQEQLNAQDLIIQQLQEELAGKASGGEIKPNVFMQTDEPVTKNGIWLKGNYTVDNIVADENIFESEEWNTTKMDNLKIIPYQFYLGSAALIGTDVYLFGGSGDNTKAYKYDTLTDTYTQLTNIPYEFINGLAAAVGTNVYLFSTNYNSSYIKYAYKYDTLTDTYTKLTDIPYACYGGSAVSVGTNVYLFGSGYTYHKRVYKYNTLTDTYTVLNNDTPYDFYYGSAVLIGTDVYLFGGSGGKTTSYKYDTLTDTYTQLTNIPYQFNIGSAVAVGTNVYLFGSGAGGSYNKYAYKYDTLADTYTKLTDIPYAFYYGYAAFNGIDIYLLGGQGNPTKVQVMAMIPNDYGNNSVVISQALPNNNKTNIANCGIQNAKFYYDRVYYQDENGELLNTIPTYNGNGTEWVKISGGEG